MASSLLVPGLNKPLNDSDYEKSQRVYNALPNDDELGDATGELIERHLPPLFTLVDRHGLLHIFGFHSPHHHFGLDDGTVQFGIDGEGPDYRRTKPTPIEHLRGRKVHGHIFVVTDTGLQPYELQDGETPDFSGYNLSEFVLEFISYMARHQLQSVIALEVRLDYPEGVVMYECFEGQESVMKEEKIAKKLGYKRGRTTGWVGVKEAGGSITIRGTTWHIKEKDGTQTCYTGNHQGSS